MSARIVEWLVRAICVGCWVTSAVSCGSQPPKGEGDSEYGTLQGALQAEGSDGATYRFPEGTLLQVAGSALEWFPLDGPEATFSLSLPVGSYQLDVVFPGDSELVRTLGADETHVPATWSDPQPFVVSILEDETTTATLNFTVKTLGQIAFATGQLDVNLDVTSTTSTTDEAHTNGDVTVFYEVYGDPAEDYATELDLDDATTYSYDVQVASTSEWFQAGSSQVCMDVEAVAVTGSGDVAWLRRLDQLSGSGGVLCVRNEGDGSDGIIVQLKKYDDPAPVDQQSFLPNSYQFELHLRGTVSVEAFDGSTLDESALSSAIPMTDTIVSHSVFEVPSFAQITYVQATASNATVTLLP